MELEHQIKEYGSLIELLEDLDREGIQGPERYEIYKRFLSFRARLKGIPYSGGFELTPLCNFDCKMCYVHLTKDQAEKEAKLLTTQQWMDIMGKAIEAGMMHADLTGGECLSYPGFKELYEYLVSRGIQVSVLTNGQLITEEIADLFKKYPPAIVQITIYGSDQDAYEQVTGRRAFDDVMAAVMRLKERGIKLLLTITPSRFMQRDTHALLELLRSLKVSYGIGMGSLQAREDTQRNRAEFAPETQLYVQLHQDEAEYQRSLREQAGPIADKKRMIIDRVPKGLVPGNIPCSAGNSTFHITWKGEMQPCVPFDTIRKSVLDTDFNDAWTWIKQKMAAYQPPKECQECSMRDICVGCPGEKTLGVLNGTLNKDVCDRFKCYLEAGIVEHPFEG